MSAEVLAWLFSLEQFGIKLGLDNILTLVAGLEHPDRAYRTVHVGGTNGKGSVTAMIDSAFGRAGYHTGRYTSPHLVDITERFAIDRKPVSRDTLIAVLADVKRLIERRLADGTLQAVPTFFG
jgi:dihydrofolate synthase/folylpolyglutamate synthase